MSVVGPEPVGVACLIHGLGNYPLIKIRAQGSPGPLPPVVRRCSGPERDLRAQTRFVLDRGRSTRWGCPAGGFSTFVTPAAAHPQGEAIVKDQGSRRTWSPSRVGPGGAGGWGARLRPRSGIPEGGRELGWEKGGLRWCRERRGDLRAGRPGTSFRSCSPNAGPGRCAALRGLRSCLARSWQQGAERRVGALPAVAYVVGRSTRAGKPNRPGDIPLPRPARVLWSAWRAPAAEGARQILAVRSAPAKPRLTSWRRDSVPALPRQIRRRSRAGGSVRSGSSIYAGRFGQQRRLRLRKDTRYGLTAGGLWGNPTGTRRARWQPEFAGPDFGDG